MVNAELQKLIQSFTTPLEAAARRAAVEEVIASIGGSAPAMKRTGGRPKCSKNAPKATGTRTAQDVVQMGEVILDFVKANPGQRADQIAKALGTTPDLLRKPMSALLESNNVKKQGVQRGTKYFVK